MQSFIMNSHDVFIHIHQGCFAGTGAIVRLPQCQWSKPDGYGKISECITTTKHSKAKTVFIFIGIYCISCIMVPKRMSLALADDKLTLVQIMAWCLPTTSHYLSQCWPKYMSSLGHNQFILWQYFLYPIVWWLIVQINVQSAWMGTRVPEYK